MPPARRPAALAIWVLAILTTWIAGAEAAGIDRSPQTAPVGWACTVTGIKDIRTKAPNIRTARGLHHRPISPI
jgi:hypothetical protein